MQFSARWFAVFGVTTSVFATASAWAQNKPFPTSGHYAQGYLPSAVTSAVVSSSYQNWKSKYLLSDCGSGYYRVDNANGDKSTFSEGQGYGMVLTAYMGDKAAFDGLWSFAQKNYNSSKLMGWHVTCSGFTTSDGGDGSASDGDTDIAFGLVVAAAQWGGDYEQQAKTYLSTLKSVDFTTCSPTGRTVVTAGSWQGSDACNNTSGSNTSYWMPAYYRVFQGVTGDSSWGKTADDVVALYNLGANSTTGIIVNEVDQNGAAVSGQTYDYNTCRVPWRAALDYLWFGTAGAKQFATKITTWANSVGISNIVDGYNADGTATGQYTGLNEFVGGFAVGAVANTSTIANTFATDFVAIDNDNGTYFGSSLRTLYLLTLSGNQWNPLESLGDGGVVVGGGGGGASDGGTTGKGGDAGSTGPGSPPGGGDAGSPGTPESDGGVGVLGPEGGSAGGSAGGSQDGGAGDGAGGSPASAGCAMSAPQPRGSGTTIASAMGLALVVVGRRRSRSKR